MVHTQWQPPVVSAGHLDLTISPAARAAGMPIKGLRGKAKDSVMLGAAQTFSPELPSELEAAMQLLSQYIALTHGPLGEVATKQKVLELYNQKALMSAREDAAKGRDPSASSTVSTGVIRLTSYNQLWNWYKVQLEAMNSVSVTATTQQANGSFQMLQAQTSGMTQASGGLHQPQPSFSAPLSSGPAAAASQSQPPAQLSSAPPQQLSRGSKSGE